MGNETEMQGNPFIFHLYFLRQFPVIANALAPNIPREFATMARSRAFLFYMRFGSRTAARRRTFSGYFCSLRP